MLKSLLEKFSRRNVRDHLWNHPLQFHLKSTRCEPATEKFSCIFLSFLLCFVFCMIRQLFIFTENSSKRKIFSLKFSIFSTRVSSNIRCFKYFFLCPWISRDFFEIILEMRSLTFLRKKFSNRISHRLKPLLDYLRFARDIDQVLFKLILFSQ